MTESKARALLFYLGQFQFVAMRSFSRNLRRKVSALGLSLSEAARRAGVSERRFSNYVCERREPDLATLMRIAAALETTPDALLGVKRSSSATIDQITSNLTALSEADRKLVLAAVEGILKMRSE